MNFRQCIAPGCNEKARDGFKYCLYHDILERQEPFRQTEPLLVERGKTHGDFKAQFETSRSLKNIIHSEKPIPDHMLEALEMICVKISRILHGDPHHKDHWRDISGYANLVLGDLEDNSNASK